MATESLVFDILARDGASPNFAKVGLAAEKASGNLKDLGDRLKDISGRSAQARVGLEGDKEAQHELDTIEVKLARLAKNVAKPNIDLTGVARARAELSGIDLALDRLDGKHVTATVDVDVNRSGLRGLLEQLHGAATGETGVFGGTGGFLSSPVGIGAIAGGALGLSALVPSVLGLGIGGLGAAGAVGGGLFGAAAGNKAIAADQANIKQITAALKTAIGGQKKELSQALQEAQKQYTKDMRFFTPFLELQGAIKNLAVNFLKPLRPIMEPLVGIVKEFGKGLADLGPQFTAFFRASLPFVRAFAGVILQLGKILLPAFTDILNEMVKSGALKTITDALVVLIKGFAEFIVALGPGLAASAKVFANVMGFIAKALPVIGTIFADIAKVIGSDWSPGHLWNVLLHSAQAFWHAVVASFHAFWHTLASSFAAFRHDVASIWDTIWDNTVGRTRRGIADVVGWFKQLPGKVIGALWGLGSHLYTFARAALGDFLRGLKSIAGSVFSWVGNFVRNIWDKVKGFFRISSPSGLFYDIGKNLMLGLFHGIKDHAGKAQGAWGSAIKFNAGLGVAQWAPLVRRVLAMEGLSPLLAARVLYQMQTESGGNPNIVNTWDSNALAGDPSKGLMQVIGSTFRAYHWPGTSWNIFNPLANIAAALNYARHVYGPSLMSGGMGIGSGKGYAFGTASAGAGWAWVGERGPELVRFRGGEQVYPAMAHPGRRGGGVVIEIRPTGTSEFDRFMASWLQQAVRVTGGGDVQAAFGTSY